MRLTKLTTAILSSIVLLCIVDSRGIAGNVKLVAMNGNQYWFSSSSPYAPQLNFHLAYQYCRTLGLQLVVLETREEVDTIASYLNSDEGSSVGKRDYWTSGNRLGADSWIWMSSGEQLNNTFSEYWLQQKQNSDGIKQCMSMKASTTRRTVFSPEDCDGALPFICEQVRCLYYNYPVTQYPDPNASAEQSALRADLEESGSGSGSSDSRARLNFSPDEVLRAQHFISGRNANSLQDKVAEEGSKVDPSTIHRRITLRPVMTSFPPSPDYINSFYRYQSIDYSATSTVRPTFKKTTRHSLWSPDPNSPSPKPDINSPNITNAVTSDAKNQELGEDQIASGSSESKNIVYVTSTTVLPGNSSTKRIGISTTSTVSREQNIPRSTSSSIATVSAAVNRIPNSHEKLPRGSLEIITTRSRSQVSQEKGEGIGIGSTVPIIVIKDGKEVSTDSSAIVFDDEANNVGGEVDTESTDSDAAVVTDTTDSTFPTSPLPEATFGRYGIGALTSGETTSQMQSDIMKMYQFQRSKSPVFWSPKGSTRSSSSVESNKNSANNRNSKSINITNRSSEINRNSNSNINSSRESRVNSTSSSTNANGPAKIGLGPRLKFRRNNRN